MSITLDLENPRFSLFKFDNEEDIIKHLIEYENLYELIDSYLKAGYNTLGERIIVLQTKSEYIVLEGNRRIAAIKCIFKYTNFLKSNYREKVKSLDLKDFSVASDIINTRGEADYKIAAKHISSLKSWNSTDKYVYYYNMYKRLLEDYSIKDSLNFIQETSPESLTEIKKSIKYYNFLSRIHALVKKEEPELETLSLLKNDVLTSRVYSALKKELNLKEKYWVDLEVPESKSRLFDKILILLGKATWCTYTNDDDENILNTRTFQKQEDWESILNNNKIVPGLSDLIQEWKSSDIKDNSEQNDNGNDSTLNNPDGSPSITSPQEGTENPTATSLDEPNPDIEPDIAKYRLFKDGEWLKDTSLNNTTEYDLINAVLLYDNNSERIPNQSSEYQKIRFSSSHQEGLLLRGSRILKNSKPDTYSIVARFENQEINFTISIYDNSNSKAPYTKESFIHDDWKNKVKNKLSKKHEYEKIITTIDSLALYSAQNTKDYKKSDVLIISFLVRALLEYSSKAYASCYPETLKNGKAEDNLGQLIKYVSENMYSKDSLKFTLENKKVIKSQDDIDLLNGIVHDYRTMITNQDFIRIFSKYIPYLESIFDFITS